MPRVKKQKRISGEITRTKILDAAENLFGARGFDAVSLREITELAEVTLALVSYHFGTKDQLFEDVIERRASILCEERLGRLKQLEERSVESIINAFMSPLFDYATSGKEGWLEYFKVLSRLSDGNKWLDVLERHFDETAQVFVDALVDVLPDAQREDVTRAFTMMLNLMLATVSQHARIDRLTGGKLEATDMKSAYAPLRNFVVAGFENAVSPVDDLD